MVQGQPSKVRKRFTSESGSSKGRRGKNSYTNVKDTDLNIAAIILFQLSLFIEDNEERHFELVALLQVFGKDTCRRSCIYSQ